MPERMHAVVQQAFGGPQVLEVAEVDRPVPLATEVLVRVQAVGGTAQSLTRVCACQAAAAGGRCSDVADTPPPACGAQSNCTGLPVTGPAPCVPAVVWMVKV